MERVLVVDGAAVNNWKMCVQINKQFTHLEDSGLLEYYAVSTAK